MTVSIMGKTLSLNCVADPKEPWDLEMSPLRTAKKDYDDAIEFLSKSPKAQEIIKKIVESAHEFKIMVTENYMNKYWSPGELAKIYRTKFDNDASLITWNSKERGAWFAITDHQPAEFNVPASHPSVQNKSTPAPAILLIHEFGHGLQYLTDKTNYEALRTASYIQPTGPEVDLRIENENILKHEAPVCLELNEQVRWQYWDNKKPN